MSWVAWILTSAVFLALYDLAKKASVRNNAVIPVLLCSTLFGCAAYLSGLAVTGRFAVAFASVDGRVLTLGILKSLIVAASWVFTFCALRTLPITIATPIRASSPALVFLIALFLYGEVPSVVQALGMILVFAGYLTFSWAGRHEGIDFLRNRAVWCAVIGAILSAVSSLWDKYVFQVAQSPIEPTQFVFQIGLVAVYAVCLAVQKISTSATHHSSFIVHRFTWRWTIPLVGILLAFSDWLMFNGVSQPGAPISVMALMRRFSVAITFVLGALFFHETNLRRKSLALVLVLSGIALLCLRF